MSDRQCDKELTGYPDDFAGCREEEREPGGKNGERSRREVTAAPVRGYSGSFCSAASYRLRAFPIHDVRHGIMVRLPGRWRRRRDGQGKRFTQIP